MEMIEGKREIFVIATPMGYMRGNGALAEIVGIENARLFNAKHHAKRALDGAFDYGGRNITDILRCHCKIMRAVVFESEFVYV